DDPAAATCETGTFTPADAVYCAVTEPDIQGGALATLGFGALWVDNQMLTCGATMTKVREFLTAVAATYTPGNVIALGNGILDESCANQQLLGREQATNPLLASGVGTQLPVIARYSQNLMMQWGDFAPAFASGTYSLGWRVSAGGYNTAF